MGTPLRTLQPGDKGADFTVLTDPIKAWLISERIKFVLRYVVPPEYTRINKDYKPWETNWYAEHGISPVSNFERSATDAMGGAPKGAANGRVAADLSAQLGFPVAAPIFCSVDQDIWSGNVAAAEDYVRAFAQAIAPYPIGLYGDNDMAYRVRDLNPVFWRAVGWRRQGSPNVTVHVDQHHQINVGSLLDPNTVRSPFTVWEPGGIIGPSPQPAPQPPVLSEEDDTMLKTLWKPAGSENVFCLEDGVQISPAIRSAWKADPKVHVVEVYDDPHPETRESVERKAFPDLAPVVNVPPLPKSARIEFS